MTGAQVHIYGVKASRDRGTGEMISVVEAWVAYPLRATVDLRNLAERAAHILDTDKREFQPAAAFRGEHDTIFWVLMGMVVLTIIFLIFLSTYWCCHKYQNK